MSVRLFLNKKQVDFFQDAISRKIQISNVSNLSERRSSFSYTIEIPKTSNNIQILDMLGTAGNTSRKPYQSVVADYWEEGLPIITNGIGIVKNSGENFSLNLIDGFRSIAEILGSKKVSELDLSAYDHDLTTEEITDSFSNTSGYIYALANFGLDPENGDVVKCERLAPSIFVHTLIDKIFSEAGITTSGGFFSNAHYKNELLTPVKGVTLADSATETAKGGVTGTLIDASPADAILDQPFTLVNNGLIGASVVAGEIVFSVAGQYTMKIAANYDNVDNVLSLEINKNGTEIHQIALNQGTGISENLPDFVFNVEASDVISINLVGTTVSGGSYDVDIEPDIYLRSNFQNIELEDYIGDLQQIELVNDVFTRYGVLVQPLESDSFEFEQIEDVLTDTANAEDWTDKVSEVIQEDYSPDYGKINKFVYKYPSDVITPTHDGEFEIDNVNLNNEKTIISSIFEIPSTDGTIGTQDLYSIPIWDINGNTETPEKTVQLDLITDNLTFKIFDEVDGINKTSNIPFIVLEDHDGQYFLDTYFPAFEAMIEDYNAKELRMNLSLIDIHNLDFFKPKYLKQFGRFFYLDFIQYTSRQLSKVKMIQI